MPNTIDQFHYEATTMDKDSNLPVNPYVRLCLKSWGGLTRAKAPVISPNLNSAQEIDDHIGHLKDDLDRLARTAKVALRKAEKETKKLVSQRGSESP